MFPKFKHQGLAKLLGYSLVELSMVLMVMGMMTGTALKMSANKTDGNQNVELLARLDAIDKALLSYRKAYNRLPCPARVNIAITETTTPKFGVADTALGTCSATTMGAADNEIVGGGVPVRTLGLPDSFAFDPWGRKIEYYVDRRITQVDAFSLYKPGDTNIGNICVKFAVGGTNTCATDAANVYRTKKALVALVSHGKNGHGAYQRIPGTRLDNGSVNAGEIDNCGANASGACSGFNRTLTMMDRKDNVANVDDTYDDTVMYRMRWHYLSAGDLVTEGDVINTSLFPADFAFTHETVAPYLFLYRMIGGGAFERVSISQPPPSSGRGVEFSQDNEYMAVTFNTAPYIYMYKRTGGTYIKLPDSSIAGTIPFEPTNVLRFSPDGKYLAVAVKPDATSLKGVYIFKCSTYDATAKKCTGNDFSLLTSQPATNAYSVASWGQIYGMEWSRDSQFLHLACTGSCTSYLRAYKLTAADTFTSVATGGGGGLGLTISPDGKDFAVNTNTGNRLIYSFDGTSYSLSQTLPSGSGYGAQYSHNGEYLAITGFSSANALKIFKRIAGVYTDMGFISVGRWSSGIEGAPASVSWSMDDKFISVSGHANQGYSQVYVFRREADQFMPVGSSLEFPGAPTGQNLTAQSASFTKPKLCENCILSVVGPPKGVYGANQNIDWTVTFDQPMNVTGIPYIPVLVTGKTCRADYQSGSGTNIFTFRMRFPSNRSAALDAYATANLGPPYHNGNTVWKYGNTWGTWATSQILDKPYPCILEWTGGDPATTPAYIGEDYQRYQSMIHPAMEVGDDLDGVDTKVPLVMKTEYTSPSMPVQPTAAAIKSVATNTDVTNLYFEPDTRGVLVDLSPAKIQDIIAPANDTYREGEKLDFYALYQEPVVVTGTPRMPVVIGATTVYANYVSGSGSGKLLFRYTIVSTDVDTDGISLTPLTVDLNGGTIKDTATNAASLVIPAKNTTGILVNGAQPGITSVSGPAIGTYVTGQALTFNVTYSSNVQDTDGSTLSLVIGANTRTASLTAYNSGTYTATFSYTIVAADISYTGFTLDGTITNDATPICKNPCMGASTYADTTFKAPSFANRFINPGWGTVNGYTVSMFGATDLGLLMSTAPSPVAPGPSNNRYNTTYTSGGGGYFNMGGMVRSVDLTADASVLGVAIDQSPYVRMFYNTTSNKARAGYAPPPETTSTTTEITTNPTLPGQAFKIRFSPDNGFNVVIAHDGGRNMTMWKRSGASGSAYTTVSFAYGDGISYDGGYGKPNVMEWSPDGTFLFAGFYGNYYQTGKMFYYMKNWWEPDYYLQEINDYYIDPNNPPVSAIYGCFKYNTYTGNPWYLGAYCADPLGKQPSWPVTAAAFTKDSRFLLVGQGGNPNLLSFRREGAKWYRDADLLRLPGNPEIRSIVVTDDDTYVAIATNRYPYLYFFKRTNDSFEKMADLASSDIPTGPPTSLGWNGRIGDNFSLLSGLESIPFYDVNMRVGDVVDGQGGLIGIFPSGQINDIKMRVLP